MEHNCGKLIRLELNGFFKDYKHLSNYRKQKIIRGEIADPCTIGYNDEAVGEEQNFDYLVGSFYHNLSFLRSTQIDFLEHVKDRYGINLNDFA